MKFATVYEVLKNVGALSGFGWLVKTLFSAYRNRLSHRDAQLLVAATTGDTLIHYFNFPNVGKPWVRAGKFDLGNSPLVQAEFVDSLERLFKLGYLSKIQDSLFTLTAKGIRAAQKLHKRIQPAEIPCEQGKTPVRVGAAVG